jgi:FAD/FMN-containing dehydrogenase
VWTHYLKGIEYLTDYSIGRYEGPAARIGAGIQAWEAYNSMAASNISFAVPITPTVGAAGGYLSGGGHSHLTSLCGLAADQVLSLNAVTAEGRFITADLNQHKDLYFALRGGGGSKCCSNLLG